MSEDSGVILGLDAAQESMLPAACLPADWLPSFEAGDKGLSWQWDWQKLPGRSHAARSWGVHAYLHNPLALSSPGTRELSSNTKRCLSQVGREFSFPKWL